MMEEKSSAKYEQYYYKEQEKKSNEFKKGFAKCLLDLPVPMSYEIWFYLHSIIGDLE